MIGSFGPLNQSQELSWTKIAMRAPDQRAALLSTSFTVFDGVPLQAGLDALDTLVRNHDILRTVFVLAPGAMPTQLVCEAKHVPVPVDIVDIESASRASAPHHVNLISDISIIRYPWHMTMFVASGTLQRVSIVCDHLLSDGYGMRNWKSQFLDLCRRRVVDPPQLQPIDRALQHRRRRSLNVPTSILDEVVIRGAQTIAPPVPGVATSRRFLECEVLYPQMMPDLDAIVAQQRVSRPAVLLLALCWLIGSYSGLTAIHATNQVHNRTRFDHGIDSCVTVPSVLVEIPPAVSFGDALRSLYRTLVIAMYEDACSSASYADRMLASSASRGIRGLFPLSFNYDAEAIKPGGAQHGVTGRKLLRWDKWHINGSEYRLRVRVHCNYSGLAPAITDDVDFAVNFQVDTAVLPAPTLHAITDLLPQLLKMIATHPGMTLQSARALLPKGFSSAVPSRLVRNNWINPEDLESCLLAYQAVEAARVAIESEDVVAYVAVGEPTSGTALHEHVLSSLSSNVGICAPHRYSIEGGGATTLWSPGTACAVVPPRNEGERYLQRALIATHGHDFPDMSLTYAQSGGKLIRFPAVSAELHRHGWSGLTPDHVLSPVTLRTIAGSIQLEEY